MSSRASADLLLVGSLPTTSTESAFREGADLFGDLVFALPDGETGPRAAWVGYDTADLIAPHPDLVTVKEVDSPTGHPRHAYENAVYRIRDGVSELHFDRWARIDDTIESYAIFRDLRDQGVIPAHLRFQTGLPFPRSTLNTVKGNFAADYPIAERAFEELVGRELRRLLDAIPASDLAIQWDVCEEVLENEGVMHGTEAGAWERFTGPVERLTRQIPEDVLVGYHFCYGTFPEWPMFEARDLSLLVKMANHAIANSGRTVDWLHIAGPRYLRSEEERFFAPLADLDRRDARVFLGIILPLDGVPGLERRHATASKYLDEFGVAMYCGFGRQPGMDGMETMREHRRVATTATSKA